MNVKKLSSSKWNAFGLYQCRTQVMFLQFLKCAAERVKMDMFVHDLLIIFFLIYDSWLPKKNI
jgi:hypothetical protein